MKLEYINHHLASHLISYHQSVLDSTADLNKSAPLQDLIRRVCTIALIPIAYPVLGIAYTINQMLGLIPSNSSLAGKILKQQIDVLRASGQLGWQEEAISLIRHARMDDPDKELYRLRGAGVLNNATEKKLDDAQNKVCIEHSTNLTRKKKQKIKALYAQALEIKKIYEDQFDVFLHAQASPWLVISYLVKELLRANDPNFNLHQFKSLRPPCSTTSPGLIESVYRAVNAMNPLGSSGIEKYSNRWFPILTLSDNDPKVREDLLSVDAFFFNYSRYESTLYFLSNNSNILQNRNIILEIAKQTIRHFNPDLSTESLSRYANRIIHAIDSKTNPCGHLFVICLPKNRSQTIHYRSHPFGIACTCHPKEEDRTILDQIQKNKLDASTKCHSPISPIVPQYRLYLPAIQPNQGQKIFLLNPRSKLDRKEIKRSIHNTVAEIS